MTVILQIESTTDMALNTSRASVDTVVELKTNLSDVEKKYAENKNKVKQASQAAYLAERLANQAQQVSSILENESHIDSDSDLFIQTIVQ